MSLWDRITGKVVDAAGLGQKKRAVTTGITAFDGPMSDLRLEIAINSHPWLQNSATTSFLLSAWAAQALQDMAAVLDATAQRQLGEPGKLPEATFVLADSLYGAALQWIEHAQRALAAVETDPAFELFLQLPAPAPRLDWVADAPPAHFVASIQAAQQLGTCVEDAMNNALEDRSRLPRKYDGAFEAIAASVRVARAKLDQVEAAESDRQAAGRARRLPPPPAPASPHAPQRGPAGATPPRQAGPGRSPVQVGSGYGPRTMSQPASPPSPPRPAEPTLGERLGLRFDAWAVTDPGARSTYQNDPARIAELEAFWRADTNPHETYRLFGLITAAVRAGQATARPGEFSRACPWIATFVALADVTIGTERFAAGQLFTLKVGPEGGYYGRGFDRLGFIPGAQPPRTPAKPQPRPRPDPQPGSRRGPAAGPPGVDMRHREERGTRPPRSLGPPASAAPPPPPVPPSGDIWLLTAAFQRPQRRASPADTERLRQLWRADPDPASTVRFHDEMVAAVGAGNIRRQGDEALRDCPWSQVYVAVNRVSVGGVQLERNEKFALDVGLKDGVFRRRIARLGSI